MTQKVESVTLEGCINSAEALAIRCRNLATSVEEQAKETRIARLRKLLTWWRRKSNV
jgi:hypothetical protein